MVSSPLLVPLDGTQVLSVAQVGGKAARLNDLAGAGFHTPRGYCLTAAAYGTFLAEHDLERILCAELGRKPLAEMRWEEMWDTALRLRSVFLARDVPAAVRAALDDAVVALGDDRPLAVRSSAPREDAAGASFAGLHESVVGVRGPAELLDAVRVVWASLWSDAALLYLAELGMDPAASRMAVVVQEQIERDRSGVAFGIDPRDPAADHQVIEAVPGACGDLVDGAVDPDRWLLARATGEVRSWRPGERDDAGSAPLLEAPDLRRLHEVLRRVEDLCTWPPDVEWTGRGSDLHLLQARPVTAGEDGAKDERRWYLGLRPGLRRLRDLRRRVADERIPALEAEGMALSRQDLDSLSDHALADAVEARATTLARWRAVYKDEFIPFAHGLRTLGKYYNDLVRPTDPFEFVGLVRGEELRALRRNQGLQELAARLGDQPDLATALDRVLDRPGDDLAPVRNATGGADFLAAFEELRTEYFDLQFAGERLCERRRELLGHVRELSRVPAPRTTTSIAARAELERAYFDAAGPNRAAEAAETLAVGRLSWRLRDDDNLLLGRVESQFLRAVETARRRLVAAGRVPDEGSTGEKSGPALAAALRDPTRDCVLAPRTTKDTEGKPDDDVRPRQLVGQPGSPGLASGPARHVRTSADLGRFRHGDVLVCDAIQPNMTHLVPLAGAIVERRGGMLIHGAIIARELGIPCVNGVSRTIARIPDDEIVTVDGDLGIVTVGPPEFRAEGIDPPGN